MSFIKMSLGVLAVSLIFGYSQIAFAMGSVEINGYTFSCQHTCVVTVTSGGQTVGDSANGWVRMFVAENGRLPVAQ